MTGTEEHSKNPLERMFSKILAGNPVEEKGIVSRIRLVLRFFIETTIKTHSDDCWLRASALAYKTLFSLVPTLAIALASFKLLKGFEGLKDELFHWLHENLEATASNRVYETIFSAVENLNAGMVGWLGGVVTIITAGSLLYTIESMMNSIWRVSAHRSILTRVLAFWLTLSAGPIMLAASLGLSGEIASNLGDLMAAPRILVADRTKLTELHREARFLPFRTDRLEGRGWVVGLDGTGDAQHPVTDPGFDTAARAARIDPSNCEPGSVARVAYTFDVPPPDTDARTRLAIGPTDGASSLAGGELIMPMQKFRGREVFCIRGQFPVEAANPAIVAATLNWRRNGRVEIELPAQEASRRLINDHALPALFSMLSMAVIIMVIPHTRVRFRSALLGGLAFAVGFEALKKAFHWYVTDICKTYTIYGTLGALPVFILWLYVLWLLFLLSAEIAYVHQNFRFLIEERVRRQRGHKNLAYTALRSMLEIAIAFKRGDGPLSDDALAGRLHVSPDTVALVSKRLEDAGLIRAAEGDGYAGYLPARDLETLDFDDVLGVIEDDLFAKPTELNGRISEYTSEILDKYIKKRNEVFGSVSLSVIAEKFLREETERA